MENTKENRKVKYTKMVIRESFFELRMQKPLQQVTVKAICDLADINRGTFYAHYTDIYDLVEKLEDEMLSKIQHIVNMDDIIVNQLKVYKSIFSNIKENIDDYRIILINPESIRRLDELLDTVYEHHFLALNKGYGLSANMIDYTYSFISQGYIQVIYKWIENGMKESPDDMALLLDKLTTNIITSH